MARPLPPVVPSPRDLLFEGTEDVVPVRHHRVAALSGPPVVWFEPDDDVYARIGRRVRAYERKRAAIISRAPSRRLKALGKPLS